MDSMREFGIGEGKYLRLYLEDCISGMQRHLEDESVSVVVTSPPYNLGINYSAYDDNVSREKYLEWTDRWGREVRRVLSKQGSFFLNVGSKPSDPMVPYQILNVMCRHFVLQNVIHWVKSIAILKREVGDYPGITQDVVVGHYKPINSPRFLNDCHEYIFHFTIRGDVALDRLAVGVPYQDKSNVSRWARASHGTHCRGNTWFIPYETIQNREKDRPHPATFPVELPTRCIKLHGLERVQLVLDPFLGIGTTALACARLELPFVGFEIAEDYFEQACKRLTSELSQVKLEL
jgi:site-specific DNA-methyltransferase (adenine-specific)